LILISNKVKSAAIDPKLTGQISEKVARTKIAVADRLPRGKKIRKLGWLDRT
jgi:hypothetical protein